MRVESAKNNQTDKKDASNFKPEKSPFDSSGAMKTADAAATAAQPSKSAFEKILTEARQQSLREKDKSARDAAHSSPSETASETSEADEKKEANRRTEEKNESKEKNRDGGSKGGGQSSEEENSPDYAAAAMALSNESKASVQTPAAAPAARSILHIADLERIVSFVRTQNFKDAQQILISLKHSVLEGLQIRLTLNENGNLKAEFLALNEQIKKQLKTRERELLDILKKRSARFSEIEILTA